MSDDYSVCRGVDIAQICLNGHVASGAMRGMPHHNKPFCELCGEPTISQCRHCSASIRGVNWEHVSLKYAPPKFCHQCGKPHIWTEQANSAALELFTEVLDYDQERREQLRGDLAAIAVDVPQTQVASFRIRKALAKVGKESVDVVRGMIVDIASEAAKKIIFPA